VANTELGAAILNPKRVDDSRVQGGGKYGKPFSHVTDLRGPIDDGIQLG
jgi:hypothetical protein